MRMGSKGLMIKQYFKVACSAGLNYTDEFLVKQVKSIWQITNTIVITFIEIIIKLFKIIVLMSSDGREHNAFPLHKHCRCSHPLS